MLKINELNEDSILNINFSKYKKGKDGYVDIVIEEEEAKENEDIEKDKKEPKRKVPFNKRPIPPTIENCSILLDILLLNKKKKGIYIPPEIKKIITGFIFFTQAKSIPVKLAYLAEHNSLSTQDLKENLASMADLVKLAIHPSLSNMILENYGFRGAPLKDKWTIMPHQEEALMWMRDRERLMPDENYGLRGGLACLTMGLGKTFITILHCLMQKRGEHPNLIVVPKTICYVWKDEIYKFFGKSISVLYLHKDLNKYNKEDAMTITRENLKKYEFVITTYNVCQSVCKRGKYDTPCLEIGDEKIFKGKIIKVHCKKRAHADDPSLTGTSIIYGTPWERVICDESPKFINPSTKTFRCIMAIYGKFKWCLTGTPINNYESDIWSQLRFLGYIGVETLNLWKSKGRILYNTQNLKKAVLSMNYETAGIELPPLTDKNIKIDLSEKERQVYDYVLGETRRLYDKMLSSPSFRFANVLALFIKLRQCAIAPYLMTVDSKREDKRKKSEVDSINMLKRLDQEQIKLGLWVHDKEGTAGKKSSKIQQVVKIVGEVPKGEKILIFSMFTTCLDLLLEVLEETYPDRTFLQIDGSVKGEDRALVLEKFKKDPDVSGMLLTLKVGSEGLNLTEATHSIIVEKWWNYSVINQAKHRNYRTGQTKPVTFYDLTVKNSIEEKMMALCEKKRLMAEAFLDGTEQPVDKNARLNKKMLGKILGL